MVKRIAIVDVLVTERDCRDALSDQLLDTVHRAIRIAVVDEASGHPVEKPDSPVGIRGDRPTVETGDNFVIVEAFKFDPILGADAPSL